MNPIEFRRHRFNIRFARCRRDKAMVDLWAVHRIPVWQLQTLQRAVVNFISRSVSIADGEDLLYRLLTERDRIKTITTGGIVMPKRDSVLEYNIVARTFAEIADPVIGDHIGSWHIPPNVRVKYAEESPGQMNRPRPSERPHSDAWAGEHPESVTFHIPLFGDWEHNFVSLYEPPEDFDESWLEPTASTNANEIHEYETRLLPRYKLVDFVTPIGFALFADCAMLHASERRKPCGPRVSIEAPFVWADAGKREGLFRESEHAPHATLMGAGFTHLFHFSDPPEYRRETSTSTKHSSSLHVIELQRGTSK